MNNAVSGTDLVVTLEQWPDDHDPGGQSTGTVDYTVRADDAYVQGADSCRCRSRGNSGGNFENVATGGHGGDQRHR